MNVLFSKIDRAPADDIDITSLWTVVRRGGLKVLAIAIAAGTALFFSLALVTPRYQSEAQLLIGGRGMTDRLRDPQVGSSAPDALASRVDKEAIASQVIALRSRDLARKLMVELNLAGEEEFNSALLQGGVANRILRRTGLVGPREGESVEDRVLRAFDAALRVYQGKDTRVITIEFTSADSTLAARAANRLAELYQDWLRAQSALQTADASDWLKPQIEKLSVGVAEAEAEVERFRSQANLFRGGAQNVGLDEQQLADLTSEVTRARTARGEAEARARTARDLLRQDRVDAIPDVQRSPVIQALIAQRVRAEREKAEGEATLLSRHPRMKQLTATLDDLRRQIAREAGAIIEGLQKEANVIALREELASASLSEMKARVGNKAGDTARLAALESQAKAKRRELDTLQANLEAARSREDARAVPLEAQIISRAHAGSVPATPKRLQLAALAMAATLMLGLVVIVTRELLAGPRPLNMPVFHEPPPLVPPTPPMRTPDPFWEPKPLLTLTSMAAVAGHVGARVKLYGSCRTLVVGEAADLAAQDEATDLARRLVRPEERVVLVDWNPNDSDRDVDGRATPGLAGLLDGSAKFEDVIRPLAGTGAHVITYGQANGAHKEHKAERIKFVLDALDEAYDHIVMTGSYDAAREMFIAISGHIDVAITVVAAGEKSNGPASEERPTLFGFTATGVEILRFVRSATSGPRMRSARPIAVLTPSLGTT